MSEKLFIDEDGDACLEPSGRKNNLVALPARDDDGSILNPEAWSAMVEAYNRRAPAAPATPTHSDDQAVDRFSAVMKAKLAKKRSDGRGGWQSESCSNALLSQMLREHVEKGDPVDVANFAMMLHQRGERIAPSTPARNDLRGQVARLRDTIREMIDCPDDAESIARAALRDAGGPDGN